MFDKNAINATNGLKIIVIVIMLIENNSMCGYLILVVNSFYQTSIVSVT